MAMQLEIRSTGFGAFLVGSFSGLLVGVLVTASVLSVCLAGSARRISPARCVCNDAPGIWCDVCGHLSTDCPKGRWRYFRQLHRLSVPDDCPCRSNKLLRVVQ